MHQLRCLIHRTSVLKHPNKRVDASNDFLLDVTAAHIIAAAMYLLKMEKIESSPSNEYCTSDVISLSKEERSKVLARVSQTIIQKFVSFKFNSCI